MKNDLMAVRNLCLANSSYLRDYFKVNKVPVYLESGVSEIGDDYVIIKEKNEKQIKVKADTVITSVGYIPTPLIKPEWNDWRHRNVYVVGDAEKVGNLRSVIWGAWDAAMKI